MHELQKTPVAADLRQTKGFLVADVRGRQIGRVVAAMYGRSASEPDALAVRARWWRMRHYVVPATAIDEIDGRSRVIGLRLADDDLRRFL